MQKMIETHCCAGRVSRGALPDIAAAGGLHPGLPGHAAPRCARRAGGRAAATACTTAMFVTLILFGLKAFFTERTTRSTPALLRPAHGARLVPAAGAAQPGAHGPLRPQKGCTSRHFLTDTPLLFRGNLVLIVFAFVVRKFNFYSSSVMCQHIKNSCNIYSPSVDNLVNLNYSLG